MARRFRGLTIGTVYSTPHSQNAWARIIGPGIFVAGDNAPFPGAPGTYLKIRELSPDGVTNTFSILISAQATGSVVEIETSGTTGGADERIFRVWKPNS